MSAPQDWQRRYAAYLFDLDGTLIDTVPDLARALNFCLAQFDLDPVDDSLARHWVGHGARVMIEQALSHQATEGDAAAMLPVFLTFYTDNIAVASRPYPDVVMTLEALQQQGARLAVVTNKLAGLSHALLQALHLEQYFDVVVGGDTAAAPKPDPAPIAWCLTQLGVTNTDALYVGDSETDVRAARAAGVPVVCVRDGYNHGVDVTTLQPDGIIDGFSELLS